jgi:leucyl-tRNA synthetase
VSDNFLDSAWYFLRYPSSGFDDRPFDPELTRTWLPVDMYVGGPEHSVLHLLYARFITMALHDLGHLPFPHPFTRFYAHGHITKDGGKMSKSRGNVINPDDYMETRGADTLRLYLMFLGPYDQGGDFTDRGMSGIERFLRRLWELVSRHVGQLDPTPPPREIARAQHRTVHKVSEDIAAFKYNTAIAALMEYLNALQRREGLHDEELSTFLLLLAPFAPHITEELWARLGKPYSIHQQPFPEADPALLATVLVQVAVQVDGRTKGVIEVPPNATEAEALAAAETLPAVASRGAAARRVIYVPGRVLNIVT